MYTRRLVHKDVDETVLIRYSLHLYKGLNRGKEGYRRTTYAKFFIYTIKIAPNSALLYFLVAGLGIAPSLGDYEPPVQLYTTPRYVNEYALDYISLKEAAQS